MGRQLGAQADALLRQRREHAQRQIPRDAVPSGLPLAHHDRAGVVQIPRQLLLPARPVADKVAVQVVKREAISHADAKHAPGARECGAQGQLFPVLIAHGQAEHPLARRRAPEMQQKRLQCKSQCPCHIAAQHRPHPADLRIRVEPEPPQREHQPDEAVQRQVDPPREKPPPRAARGRDAVLLAGRRRGIGRQHGDGQIFVHVQPVPLGAVVAKRTAGRIRLLPLADVLLEHAELPGRCLGQRPLPRLHRADVRHGYPQLPQQAHLAQGLHVRFRIIAVAVRAARRRDQPLLFIKPDVRARHARPAFHFRYVHPSHLPFFTPIIGGEAGLQSRGLFKKTGIFLGNLLSAQKQAAGRLPRGLRLQKKSCRKTSFSDSPIRPCGRFSKHG